jgi:hypothetical protein
MFLKTKWELIVLSVERGLSEEELDDCQQFRYSGEGRGRIQQTMLGTWRSECELLFLEAWCGNGTPRH